MEIFLLYTRFKNLEENSQKGKFKEDNKTNESRLEMKL